MIWNKKFKYPKTNREAIEGERHYHIYDEKLPSVTTILQNTQSDEKKASLENWKRRVGAQSAENIKKKPICSCTRIFIGSRHRNRICITTC